MKKQMTVRKTVLAALFLAIGLILPFITMQIPAVGKMLCPMHIPVLLCGYILGGPYGLIVGFITPLLRSVTFGMPVMLPNAIFMACELATYGLVSGILSGKMKKDMRSLYISLIISMLAGRLVWGLVSAIVYALMGSGFTWKLFFMGGFVNAIPGIVIQLILIPVLVNRLYAAGVVKPAYEGKSSVFLIEDRKYRERSEKYMELKTQCRERFKPAVDAINEIIKQEDNTDRPILVAIDGRCGSGKTTLGEYLKGQFDCNLFHMDDFFLRMEQRTPDRMKETGGNVDYERFYETVLIPVQKKESVCYQPFSCKEWRLLDAYEIPYKRINIIEGSYSLHPYFGKPYQLKIFMNIASDVQLANIRKRNGEEKAKEFQEKWIPKEEAYFEKFHVQDDTLEIMWNLKVL